jgi:hypothetical protein
MIQRHNTRSAKGQYMELRKQEKTEHRHEKQYIWKNSLKKLKTLTPKRKVEGSSGIST